MFCSRGQFLRFFFTVALVSSCSAMSEETRIVKVLDAGVFMIQDGRRIRLACLRPPSILDSDFSLKRFADRIMVYAVRNMLNEKVTFEFEPKDVSEGDVMPVHVFLKSAPKAVTVNQVYVEKWRNRP
jgi:hypothetical protein